MPKKKAGSETTTAPHIELVEAKIAEVTTNFGREDLNALRDALNEVIRKLN